MNLENVMLSDYNVFIKNTLLESKYLSTSYEALGSSSLQYISNEGLLDWAKDKLTKLGQRFVILVNKIVARFSKNRVKLEENIKAYKANPNADVKLAVSPRTLKMILMVSAVVCATIGAMVLCIPKKDGHTRIGNLYRTAMRKIQEVKAAVKKDKASKQEPVKASDAVKAAEAAKTVSEKTEAQVKKAANDINNTKPSTSNPDEAKGSVGNAAAASKASIDLVNNVAGLQDVAAEKAKVEDYTKQRDYVVSYCNSSIDSIWNDAESIFDSMKPTGKEVGNKTYSGMVASYKKMITNAVDSTERTLITYRTTVKKLNSKAELIEYYHKCQKAVSDHKGMVAKLYKEFNDNANDL